MANTAKTETIKDDHKMQFAEKYFEDLKLDETSDDFGRPANKWNVKKEEVGTYANTPDATFTKKVTKADVYNAIGKTVYDDLKDGDATLTTYFDGVETKVKAADVESTWANKNDTGKVNTTGNGDLTEIYVDDDNNVTIVTIRTYVFQAATDYDAKKESVNLTQDGSKADNQTNAGKTIVLNDRTVEAEDYAVVKNLKADDYVLVTAVKNGSGYDVKSVEAAEVKTVEVSGYKLNDSVDVASTTYKYNANADSIKGTSYNVGKQATLVLDKYGYIIAVEESVVLSDYVYIEKFGSTSSLNAKALANAIFADGTDAEITVKEVLGVKNKTTIANYGTSMAGWYTYSKNTANEYTLYAIESKYNQMADSFTGNGTEVTVNGKVNPIKGTKLNGVLANDNTVILVSDKDDDITVYTGVKNFPGVKLTSASSKATVSAVVKTSNGYASLVYIDVDGSATITGDKNSNLVYVVEYDGKYVTKDNETFYKYTVLNGEDEVKIEADNQIQNITGSVYGVANYLTKSGDRYTDFQLVNQDKDVVVYGTGSSDIKQSAGTLVLGTDKFVVASDAKITLVTTKGAAVLNKDADAAYEVSANMTAKELVDALAAANTYTYTYAGKTTDSDNEVLKELYVTVTAATASNGNNNQNANADAGVATVDYTVASNGLLRYKLNYTAPSYVADNATVKFDLDVYASGKFYDTISYQNGKKLSAGEFTVTDRAFGYPDDEELTFEMSNITFTAVKVEYKGTGAKVTGQDKTLTVGTDTLDFTLDTTATSGTVNYTVTQGKNTLKTGSIDLATSKVVSVPSLTITDDAAVVVTIEGMDKLTELYKVTVPTVSGFTFTTVPAAAASTGVAKGTEVYVYVNASTAVDAGVYGKEIAVAGYNTVLLTNADSTTAKKEVAKITVSKDVTLTATATEIAKLAQDGAATASTDGKTITVKFNRDIADGATFTTDGDAVITGVTVSGKTATITLNNALASGKKITITSVKDAVYAANELTTGDAYTA